MYVTKPLSMYRRDPSALALPPPEGPTSGILVIQDEEADPTCCFGLFKSDRVRDLPFPQNKNLQARYTTSTGESSHVSINRVLFIPVINQPLSSNLYYVIERKGKHTGEAYANSTEEDKATCCCFSYVSDLKPQSLDPQDVYQQFHIRKHDWGGFAAKSLATDGYPPYFLRRKGWYVHTSTPREFEITEALGLDTTLRACLPDLNFPLTQKSSSIVVVGKWYCPFMFIKERTLKDQLKSSAYYVMTLEQRWEKIFGCENINGAENSVSVDVVIEAEVAAVGGGQLVAIERVYVVDGVMWFKSLRNDGGENVVGLSSGIVERMKWEEERFGWVSGDERRVRVKRREECQGVTEWRSFGCYVLVERFVLKRMDGSLVMTYDFKHTQHIRCKWE